MSIETYTSGWNTRWICTECGYNDSDNCWLKQPDHPSPVCRECGCTRFEKKIGRSIELVREGFFNHETISKRWEYRDNKPDLCQYCLRLRSECECGAAQDRS